MGYSTKNQNREAGGWGGGGGGGEGIHSIPHPGISKGINHHKKLAL